MKRCVNVKLADIMKYIYNFAIKDRVLLTPIDMLECGDNRYINNYNTTYFITDKDENVVYSDNAYGQVIRVFDKTFILIKNFDLPEDKIYDSPFELLFPTEAKEEFNNSPTVYLIHTNRLMQMVNNKDYNSIMKFIKTIIYTIYNDHKTDTTDLFSSYAYIDFVFNIAKMENIKSYLEFYRYKSNAVEPLNDNGLNDYRFFEFVTNEYIYELYHNPKVLSKLANIMKDIHFNLYKFIEFIRDTFKNQNLDGLVSIEALTKLKDILDKDTYNFDDIKALNLFSDNIAEFIKVSPYCASILEIINTEIRECIEEYGIKTEEELKAEENKIKNLNFNDLLKQQMN